MSPMSLIPAPKVALLDLPASWWGCFFQHVAATSDGVRSVAVLSSTCKTLHAFSEELEYSYQEIEPVSCSQSTDPFWLWLAKQEGRVPSLTARIEPFSGTHTLEGVELQAEEWEQPIRLLSSIPKLQLTAQIPLFNRVHCGFIKYWLEDHAALIGHLEAECVPDDEVFIWPSLEGLVKMVRPWCKSLNVCCYESPDSFEPLASLTGLTSLEFSLGSPSTDSFWVSLAALTGLQKLQCRFRPSHDPSPLLTFTNLTFLHLSWYEREYVWPAELVGGPESSSFSSLQPLSTLQQLQVLKLEEGTCTATSLQGLAGLVNLQKVEVCCKELESLQGLSPAVTSLRVMYIQGARPLGSLAGIETGTSLQELDVSCGGLTSLQGLATLSNLRAVSISSSVLDGDNSSTLEVFQASSSCLRSLSITNACGLGSVQGAEKLAVLEELTLKVCGGVTSLKPLGGLGSQVKKLHISGCGGVVEKVLKLPYVQPTADVNVVSSNVREVVLAGGLRCSLCCC